MIKATLYWRGFLKSRTSLAVLIFAACFRLTWEEMAGIVTVRPPFSGRMTAGTDAVAGDVNMVVACIPVDGEQRLMSGTVLPREAPGNGFLLFPG